MKDYGTKETLQIKNEQGNMWRMRRYRRIFWYCPANRASSVCITWLHQYWSDPVYHCSDHHAGRVLKAASAPWQIPFVRFMNSK